MLEAVESRCGGGLTSSLPAPQKPPASAGAAPPAPRGPASRSGSPSRPLAAPPSRPPVAETAVPQWFLTGPAPPGEAARGRHMTLPSSSRIVSASPPPDARNACNTGFLAPGHSPTAWANVGSHNVVYGKSGKYRRGRKPLRLWDNLRRRDLLSLSWLPLRRCAGSSALPGCGAAGCARQAAPVKRHQGELRGA